MKIQDAVKAYVSLRLSLGFDFLTQRKQLRRFCKAMGSVEVGELDSGRLQTFLSAIPPASRANHYHALRGFVRYAIPRGLMASSPLPTAVPKKPQTMRPYVYSPDELKRLLEACTILDHFECPRRRRSSITSEAFRVIIQLLYGAGLRVGELVRLNLEDVNLQDQRLMIRSSKFGKTRLLPIGPRLTAALAKYRRRRNLLCENPPTSTAFFLRRSGIPLRRCIVTDTFAEVRKLAGIARNDGAYYQPRVHDLRHTFAVHRLVDWYNSGRDVQQLLPKLSTYLGHVCLVGTQTYLTMTPELLQEANRLFENYADRRGGL